MQVHNCEQGTDEWFLLRAGTPTASEFKNLITAGGKEAAGLSGYAATLAADAFARKPLERWAGNQWTDRGHEMEPRARSSYEFINDVEVKEVGFVTNFDAGCSPDGIVGEDGLLEIKSLAPKGHVEALAYIAKHNKCPTAYFPQVQGQLLICEREWCDLYLYHPELPHKRIRIERDPDYLKTLTSQIEKVLKKRDEFMDMLEAV